MSHTDKNNRTIWRKRQTNFPNFLKMRMFLSKLGELFANFDKYILILRKLGNIFCLFLMIFSRFLSVQAMWYHGFLNHLLSKVWNYFESQIIWNHEYSNLNWKSSLASAFYFMFKKIPGVPKKRVTQVSEKRL